jgi:DNA repair protein RecO (recombination protein O)
MAGLYRDEGVVLRTVKLGEADRIVTIFTAEHGKVRAVAKGVRRSGSRFGARLEPVSNVAVQCHRGRDLDVVTQVECIDVFRSIREDYANLTRAVAILEVVDQLSPDREPNPALHRMLVGALRTLDATPSPVITPAFFWKASRSSTPACGAAKPRRTTRRSISPRAGCCARRAAGSAGPASPPKASSCSGRSSPAGSTGRWPTRPSPR